ncbi:unnamed protein product, partial [Bubo scandiacus]
GSDFPTGRAVGSLWVRCRAGNHPAQVGAAEVGVRVLHAHVGQRQKELLPKGSWLLLRLLLLVVLGHGGSREPEPGAQPGPWSSLC